MHARKESSLRTRITIAALLTAALAGFGPSGASAGTDPVSTLQADLTTLQSDIAAAHDALLADLAKVTTDVGTLQGTSDEATARTTIKADLQKFRSDRSSLLGPVKADREQVRADLKAAKNAKTDPSAIKPLLLTARSHNKATLAEIRQAAQKARAAVKALIQGFAH